MGSTFLQVVSHVGNGSTSQLALINVTAGTSSIQDLQLLGCLWPGAFQKQDHEAWLDRSDLSEGLLALRTDSPSGIRALADAPASMFAYFVYEGLLKRRLKNLAL